MSSCSGDTWDLPLPPPYKATNPIGRGLFLTTSFNINYLLKAGTPHTAHWGARASTYESGGYLQSTAPFLGIPSSTSPTPGLRASSVEFQHQETVRHRQSRSPSEPDGLLRGGRYGGCSVFWKGGDRQHSGTRASNGSGMLSRGCQAAQTALRWATAHSSQRRAPAPRRTESACADVAAAGLKVATRVSQAHSPVAWVGGRGRLRVGSWFLEPCLKEKVAEVVPPHVLLGCPPCPAGSLPERWSVCGQAFPGSILHPRGQKQGH